MKTLAHAPDEVHPDRLDVDETFGLFPDGYPDEAPELPIGWEFEPDDQDEDWAEHELNLGAVDYEVTRLGLYDRIASGEDATELAELAAEMHREYDRMADLFDAMARMERGLDGCDHGGSLMGHDA